MLVLTLAFLTLGLVLGFLHAGIVLVCANHHRKDLYLGVEIQPLETVDSMSDSILIQNKSLQDFSRRMPT